MLGMGSASDPKRVTGYTAAGVAYAYPAPPPTAATYYAATQPAGPAAYYAPAYVCPTRDNTLLRRLIAVAIGVFVVICVATFIFWLVFRPRFPEFSVSSAAVSSFNLSSPTQQLSVDFDLTLSIRNPNKKISVFFDSVSAMVLYGARTIAETWLPPFYQDKGNTTTLRARLATVAEHVEADVFRGIAADRAGGGVSFDVRAYALVMFRAGAWRTRWHVVIVYCENVRIGFKNATNGAGSLVGPPKQCQVRL